MPLVKLTGTVNLPSSPTTAGRPIRDGILAIRRREPSADGDVLAGTAADTRPITDGTWPELYVSAGLWVADVQNTAGYSRFMVPFVIYGDEGTTTLASAAALAAQAPGRPPLPWTPYHTHQINSVTGLADHLAAFEYDSGWRDVSALLSEGLAKSAINGRCNLRRMKGRLLVDMNLTISKAELTSVMTFPSGFRADIPALAPYTYWTSTTANNGLPSTLATSYVGGGGTTLRVTNTPAVGTLMIYLDFPARGAIPTILPGDPI